MDNYEQLKLKNQICFPLYAASRKITQKYKPFLDELNLTYTQYIAMMVLWERKTLTVKELGDCLYLDSGTLTPMLKKMEQSGLLTRSRNEADERSTVVAVTEKGEELKQQAKDIPQKMSSCVELTKEEAFVLYSILQKLLK